MLSPLQRLSFTRTNLCAVPLLRPLVRPDCQSLASLAVFYILCPVCQIWLRWTSPIVNLRRRWQFLLPLSRLPDLASLDISDCQSLASLAVFLCPVCQIWLRWTSLILGVIVTSWRRYFFYSVCQIWLRSQSSPLRILDCMAADLVSNDCASPFIFFSMAGSPSIIAGVPLSAPPSFAHVARRFTLSVVGHSVAGAIVSNRWLAGAIFSDLSP
jgi:hypothetical protein